MSSSKTVTVKGKCKWADVHTIGKYGKYSIRLYPNAEDLEFIRSFGLKNKIGEDEDGKYVNFSRPPQKIIRGQPVAFGAPIVTDKENYIINTPIGNGSDVTLTLTLYSYRNPSAAQGAPLENAIRLDGVRVDNLVPFSKESIHSPTAQHEKVFNALENTPPQIAGWR